jgi:hypothetical protein
MIHPIVLGSGQRLFDHDNHLVKLQLVGGTTTTSVIIATYQPALQGQLAHGALDEQLTRNVFALHGGADR